MNGLWDRREILKRRVAWDGVGLAGCAVAPPRLPERTRGLVVGGGYGEATAARYLRLLSVRRLEVMPVEPNENFISCPGSELLPGGGKSIAEFTRSHAGLSRSHGVTVVKDHASSIDAASKVTRLASGPAIDCDKLVLSPGIELM